MSDKDTQVKVSIWPSFNPTVVLRSDLTYSVCGLVDECETVRGRGNIREYLPAAGPRVRNSETVRDEQAGNGRCEWVLCSSASIFLPAAGHVLHIQLPHCPLITRVTSESPTATERWKKHASIWNNPQTSDSLSRASRQSSFTYMCQQKHAAVLHKQPSASFTNTPQPDERQRKGDREKERKKRKGC